MKNSPIKRVSTKLVPGAMAKPSGNIIAPQCIEYLTKLHSQLKDVVKNGPDPTPFKFENLPCNLSKQPIEWISKWIDHKDGFGYQLCDESVGVVFNDRTTLILSANGINMRYIEKNGSERYYKMNEPPGPLAKKTKLLSFFNHYMSEKLHMTGAGLQPKGGIQLRQIPYLHRWHKTTSAIAMQLTDGTLQINFTNHAKLILCPLMETVTYINAKKRRKNFSFSTLAKCGYIPDIHKSLDYALNEVNFLSQNTLIY